MYTLARARLHALVRITPCWQRKPRLTRQSACKSLPHYTPSLRHRLQARNFARRAALSESTASSDSAGAAIRLATLIASRTHCFGAATKTMLATLAKTRPGLGAAVATAAGGVAVATQMPESLHISGIPCSLVLGAVANNLAPANVRQALQPGVKFATTTVLRAGIVAVGAKLSATQVLALGWTTVPAACASVGAGLVAIPLLAKGAGCRRGSARC